MKKQPSRRDPFEEYIDAIEANYPSTTLFAILKDGGIPLPNPDEVSDDQLSSVLWTVINALWDEDVILYSTDHLSDRELYTLLWTDLLIEEYAVIPNGAAV